METFWNGWFENGQPLISDEPIKWEVTLLLSLCLPCSTHLYIHYYKSLPDPWHCLMSRMCCQRSNGARGTSQQTRRRVQRPTRDRADWSPFTQVSTDGSDSEQTRREEGASYGVKSCRKCVWGAAMDGDEALDAVFLSHVSCWATSVDCSTIPYTGSGIWFTYCRSSYIRYYLSHICLTLFGVFRREIIENLPVQNPSPARDEDAVLNTIMLTDVLSETAMK